MNIRRHTLRAFLCLCSIAPSALGQQEEIVQLKAELAAIRTSLDSLRSLLRPQSFGNDPVELLEERLEQRLSQLEQKITAISSSTAPIVFNPRTTAFINMAARVDSRSVLDEEGATEISNRPFLRGLELDFRAAVDPYAEAVAIVALENEAGEGYAIEPEEVYGLIKRIPILESAPGGVKMKLGRFRAPFGVNNKLHLHDMPWVTRPLIVSKYLGTEHGDFFESGYNPVGLDMDFFLPSVIPGVTLEMNADIVGGGALGLARSSTSRPGFLGHITASRDWQNEHLLVAGLSGYTESGRDAPRLVGADVLYRWVPSERRASNSLVIGAEIFQGRTNLFDSSGSVTRSTVTGWYGYLQYQLSYAWYVGARYDWVEEPEAPSTVTRALSLYASYYTTEFLRIRAGIERRHSALPDPASLTTALFEVNFVFGSHPTEPYWVNR
ncbi:MAG: hypothetical protein HBSIN02_12800 [Bacteroidia bacterium]|nr:MAG: hypothetical protein HBSIN02_12800 [Bacteroidia bacterium]